MRLNQTVRRRIVFGALVVISLVLLTVFFREPASGALHALQRGSLGVLSPLQTVASKVTEPFEDGYQWVKDLLRAKQQNKELSTELQQLQGRVLELQEASDENVRLRDLLDFRESGIFPGDCRFVVARVVAKSPTKWEAWIKINKGTADGIQLNQPVVGASTGEDPTLSGKGLVGKVIAVSDHAAQIQLITDQQSSVAAKVQATVRAEGILNGTVSGKLYLDYVERDQTVDAKMIVITSGIGDIFPKGIPIGVVESVGEEDVNVYKQIEVRPFVNFGGLEEVMVILTAPPNNADISDMESVKPAEGRSEQAARER